MTAAVDAPAWAIVDDVEADPVWLEREVEGLDLDLVRLIGERSLAARRLAAARAGLGGSRYAHEDELAAVRRFRALGPIGPELAVLLLRLARASDAP